MDKMRALSLIIAVMLLITSAWILLTMPRYEKQITKGMMWDMEEQTYKQIGMWCQLNEMGSYVCEEYHDNWIDERCEIIERCK